MYGHLKTMAEAEAKGIREAGGQVDLFQVAETLPDEVLAKMHAPPKDSNIQTLHDPTQLLAYDAFLLGIPTRYGEYLQSPRVEFNIADHNQPQKATFPPSGRLSGTRPAVSGRAVVTGASTPVSSSAPAPRAAGKNPLPSRPCPR